MDAMLPATALLSAAIGAAAGVLMYRLGPAIGVAALIAPALVVIVASRPELGVYGGLLAIPLEAFGVRIGSVDSTLAELVFLGTAGVAFVRVFVIGHAWSTLAPAHLWFAGLIGVALLGSFFASDTTGIVTSVRNACAFLILSILVAGLERRSLEHLLWLLVGSGGIVGFIALMTTGPQQAEEAGAIVSGRATAAFNHPNVLGFYLLLTLGPALALLFDRSWWGRLLVGAALVGVIGGLLLTFSRSAIVGAVAVFLVLTASSRFRRTAVLGLLVAAAFAAINFGALTSSREVGLLQQRLSTVSAAGAEQDPRIPIWRETPSIIGDRFPLGWGQANFHVASSAHGLLDPRACPGITLTTCCSPWRRRRGSLAWPCSWASWPLSPQAPGALCGRGAHRGGWPWVPWRRWLVCSSPVSSSIRRGRSRFSRSHCSWSVCCSGSSDSSSRRGA